MHWNISITLIHIHNILLISLILQRFRVRSQSNVFFPSPAISHTHTYIYNSEDFQLNYTVEEERKTT